MPGKILMVTWDGAGNIPPAFALCQSLVKAGYSVHVLTHDSLSQRVFDIGATFIRIKEAGQFDSSLETQSNEERIQKILDNVLLSKAFLTDLDAALDETSPNLVIVDSMMLLALALVKQHNIPTIAFHHTLADYVFGGEFEEFFTKGSFDSIVEERELSVKDFFDSIVEAWQMSAYETPIQALYEANVILTSTYKEFDSLNARV